MKIAAIERYEEHSVILELDKDFTEKDLVSKPIVDALKGLNSETLTKIANKNGYTNWCWQGAYDPKTKTLKAHFQKKLYVDPVDNTVIAIG